MREILFRGKCQTGEWVCGGFVSRNGKPEIVECDRADDGDFTFTTQVDPATVGQFTGLHDKNGVEIFEGDILEVNFNDDCCNIGKQKAIIKYSDKHASFLVEPLDDWSFCGMDEGEVIGNIHEGGNECTSAIVE